MSKVVPHIAFGVAYGIFGIALGAVLDSLSSVRALQHLAGPAVAPLALLFAWRFGALTWSGVLVASALVALAAHTAIVVILHAIAVPAGGSVGFFAPAITGGWVFALSNALLLLSPLVWLHLLGRGSGSTRIGSAA